jgi:hypothetical protein
VRLALLGFCLKQSACQLSIMLEKHICSGKIIVYFHIFFFSRHYNPWCILVCFTISFHNLLSLYFSLQFLTFVFFISSSTSRRCLHFEVVGGLEWSNDPESYAGSSVATSRASLAGKVKGDDPD